MYFHYKCVFYMILCYFNCLNLFLNKSADGKSHRNMYVINSKPLWSCWVHSRSPSTVPDDGSGHRDTGTTRSTHMEPQCASGSKLKVQQSRLITNENVCSPHFQPMKTFVVPGSELEVHRAQHRVAGPLNGGRGNGHHTYRYIYSV